MSDSAVPAVKQYRILIHQLLHSAEFTKSAPGTSSLIRYDYIAEDLGPLRDLHAASGSKSYAAIETACRDIFYDLLASTDIESPDFVQVWNLLDIFSILSDLEYCEPGLVLWLVEELLDSQTIDGCRIVFDYLDSRRELLTAKHFKQKNLIILRACNELLRRLSRAEDTVFCGRVFIFLFQSFPLGDRSSVNLRGEFHVENTTVFEDLPQREIKSTPDEMQVDEETPSSNKPAQSAVTADPDQAEVEDKNVATEVETAAKSADKEPDSSEASAEMDKLYATFWSMQDFFSQPVKLFNESNLTTFQASIAKTLSLFKETDEGSHARGHTSVLPGASRDLKRKREGAADDNLSNSFNPKYLTSRDLFDLEINDLSFRRHILVQALILIDFLLSLTPKAKKKLAHASNKSVLYTFTLDEEHAKWAKSTRNEIATYLQQGPEGKFYYRMVDTVLSRDKNWASWKAEGCPPIARDPVTAESYSSAESSAQKNCANKRIRPTALGTLDLNFLPDPKFTDNDFEILKDPSRYAVPTMESFRRPIEDDQFEIEMAKDDEERTQATEARASKLWRLLRIASKSKLSMFDKINDGNNLGPLFGDPAQAAEVSHETEAEAEADKAAREKKDEAADDPIIQEGDDNILPAETPAMESSDQAMEQDQQLTEEADGMPEANTPTEELAAEGDAVTSGYVQEDASPDPSHDRSKSSDE